MSGNTYSGTAAQLESDYASIIPAASLANLLSSVSHGAPYNVTSSDGNKSVSLASGLDLALIDNDVATISSLNGTSSNAAGGYDNIGSLAVNVTNTSATSIDVAATNSAFIELQGTATVSGGTAPTFVVDASHDSSNVSLMAGSGSSFLIGGAGSDTLTGSTSTTGHAVLVAGSGATTMTGGTGSDSLYGGGHTTMTGGSGGYQVLEDFTAGAQDSIYAGTGGHETLAVASGSSKLFDISGTNDSLYAGSGSDTLYGSTSGTSEFLYQGNSTVISTGSDTVSVAAATMSHTDTITASTVSGAMDTVSFAGQSAGTLNALVSAAKVAGSDSVTISFGSGSSTVTATLNNVSHIQFK